LLLRNNNIFLHRKCPGTFIRFLLVGKLQNVGAFLFKLLKYQKEGDYYHIKYKMPKNKKIIRPISIDPDISNKIAIKAKKLHRNYSNLVETICANFLSLDYPVAILDAKLSKKMAQLAKLNKVSYEDIIHQACEAYLDQNKKAL